MNWFHDPVRQVRRRANGEKKVKNYTQNWCIWKKHFDRASQTFQDIWEYVFSKYRSFQYQFFIAII